MLEKARFNETSDSLGHLTPQGSDSSWTVLRYPCFILAVRPKENNKNLAMEPLGSAAAVPAATNPTFLFIPGSFHPGALFDRVILEIGKRGFPSVAIDRPSIVQASNSTLDPYADVQAIRAKVEGLVVQEGKDIILVCHSAGGVVGSRSVKGYEKTAMMHRNVKGGIIGVWFLAAFLLKDGVNIIATLGGGVPDWVDDEVCNLAVKYWLRLSRVIVV